MTKNIFYIVILTIFIWSCASTKKKNSTVASNDTTSDTLRIANDELEYEIIIIEPGFNSWLVTQRPRGYYGEQFLESRNRRYVIEYNQRVIQPFNFDPNLYVQAINYEPNIHYGHEVNYLLYHYFLFFEQRHGQRFIFSRGARF